MDIYLALSNVIFTPEINSVCKIYKTKVAPTKSYGKKIGKHLSLNAGKHLSLNALKLKPTFYNIHTYTHFKKYLNQDQIIEYIQDGRLFGFVECDIEVPAHLKEYFSEMTPILKNVNVCLDDVGELMQEYAKEHSIKDVLVVYNWVLFW